MKALKITSVLVVTFFLGLAAWVLLLSDPMGGEPTVTVALDHQNVLAVRTPPAEIRGQNSAPVAPFDRSLSARLAQPAQSSTPRTMSPVPVRALVEYTQFGPLPKISADGRKPSQVYARPFNLPARPGPGEPSRIAIVINGLGVSETNTYRAVHNLPGPVTLAFSAYGQNLQGWVKKARELGHEVVLQVPLEPYDYPDNDPGPHTLLTGLPPQDNLKRLQWLMGRMTGYVGLTNAMGAKFATAEDAIKPVMEELNRRGLYYFDTGESPRSLMGKLASEVGVGFSRATVQIDLAPTAEDIDAQLLRLEQIAGEESLAIGVGTPLPLTIERIQNWAKTLEQKNAILIPISAAVRSARGS